jgi:hypothetical protein
LRLQRFALLVATAILIPSLAHAQDFGVMESAETINTGNFKLKANPMFVFGKDGANDDNGIALGAGYGLTPKLDVEGKVALYGGMNFFGGNLEYSLLKANPLDLSVIGGLHFLTGDKALSTRAVDVTLLGSKHVARKLEVFGALDLSFNKITDDAADGIPGFDTSYTQVHLVPGIEYALSDQLDFLAEVGLGLNDNSSHYISAGIAYYLR